ncbi:16596_t:CDS:2 [Acaulospora morrowiae]|uniref:16596_t:CDS:1 n=1 Tax=Acaulospora morrowiae TaxID=94023 RepID=A0A9N8VG30_9GLOM|nr:16596_t:CDS:2 [Acaulospora morrowiae]
MVFAFFIKYLYKLILVTLKRSLIKSSLGKDQKIYFCKTFHSRFFPVKHSFEYPVLYLGVDLDLLERNKDSGGFLLGYNNKKTIFNINDDDYLGAINPRDIPISFGRKELKSIKEKLFWYISRHDISTEGFLRVELVTMPRLLNYAFNPVNFYFCYDLRNSLSVVVLEINNTFGEKHLHILDRDHNDNNATRIGYDMSFTTKRAFHVSPFNDRKGTYKVYCKDPASGYLDVRFVMHTDSSRDDDASDKKKFVATAVGHSYILNRLSLLYAMLTYPTEIFLTMPRILKEAYKLHYNKKLGIYHKPIPIEGTVVKLEPNSLDLYAQEIVVKYLSYLISQINELIYITINLPNFNKPPIKLQSDPNEPFSPFFHNSKHIILNLHDYTFFTNFVINQIPYRALILGYYEKAWDCNNLPLLFHFLFNLPGKRDDINTIHRDHKVRLNKYELMTAMLRRRYWRNILKDEESGGLKEKAEFDEILQNLWPPEGVDQDFIASVMQNDVCYDLRINAKINSHEDIAIAIRDLLAMDKEGKIVALFGYTHLYLFTIPSNNSIRHLSPIISKELHLFPFPPRYLPYENKEPILHPIDRFLFSSSYATSNMLIAPTATNVTVALANKVTKILERLKHIWMLLLMTSAYQLDSTFWQMITGFVNGPSGNPFLAEKWLWEGVIDILNNGKNYSEEGVNSKLCQEDKVNGKNKNLFEGWEVIYERIDGVEHLQLATTAPPMPKLPMVHVSTRNLNIESDKQQRLWYFMKCYRKVVLFRDDFDSETGSTTKS